MNALALAIQIAVLLSSVLLVTGLVRARRGAAHPGGPVHDRYEAAFLGGGPGRVVDTALTAMATDGRLAVGGPGIVAVQRNEAHDLVERAVLQELAQAPNGSLHGLRTAVMRHPAVQEIGDGLAARGLLVVPGTGRGWRRWGLAQGLVCLLAVPFTVVLTAQDALSDELAPDGVVPFPVRVIPSLLVGVVVGFVCASRARGRVTRAGRRAAREYRTAHALVPDAALLVAAQGPRALPDPELRAQLTTAARTDPQGRAHAAAVATGASALLLAPVVWCAGDSGSGGGCGSSGDGGGDGGGSGCGGGGGDSGGDSGSGCGGGSSCGGGCGGGGGD
ncbi:TIGR04222 domain-containing membrane protein [Streptomyces sp. NPDC092952]|uniref:TIGR04222 domain-containing membrane protein n=1 Tax=Streptomyces sp. NPDC092952 TaxID=3366018 RepID=UPI0038024710